MKPADPQKPHIAQFCSSIVSNGNPVAVPNASRPSTEFNECINIVKSHVRENGGKQHLGWAIWEWEGTLLEAQFHSVWESDDGTLLDVTPQLGRFRAITFIIDPSLRYKGIQIDNIRKLLVSDPLAERYCILKEKVFIEMNRGDLAHQYGAITLEGEAAETYQQMQIAELEMFSRFPIRV